jgi:phage gp29-like protein
MRDIRNYWYPASPLGGYTQSGNNAPSATNLERYLTPLITPRVKQDALTWKDALAEAEIPLPLLSYRYKMQQMFNDVVLDAHVFACMDRRKDMTLLKGYSIVDSKGNEDELATELVNQKWFKDILNYTMDAIFYGYTLLGVGDIVDGKPEKVTLLRRQNVSPDRLNVAFVPYSPGGIQFMDPEVKDSEGRSFYDWTLWFPTPSDFGISPCGYGLLYKVALYQILLRNNLGDNSTYNEIFGQPTRIAKTSKKDGESRNRLLTMLEMMGSTAYAILDPDDQIEFVESKNSSGRGNDTYDNFEQRLEKKISKIILGHADAMDSTPGKLGASGKGEDALTKALQDKEKKDVDFLETACNDVILPKLSKLGIKIPLGKKLKFKNDKEKQDAIEAKNTNSKSLAEIVKTLKDAGYEVPEEFITESTGIPVKKSEVPIQANKQFSEKVQARINDLYKTK